LFTASGQRVHTTDCGNRYSDDAYEYRHVQLPKQMLKIIPKDYFDGARGTLKLLWEEEWRALGITQVWDSK
jgi:cyclin-dependent kinase regulatory subunit CKS1